MKRIQKDAFIIEHVDKFGLREEYVVENDANLLLIFVARVTDEIILAPSIRLIKKGSNATVLGAVYATGKGSVNIKTLQHHEAENTTSNLLIKCVMADESSCIYEGSIFVDKQAQKTNAYQRNENLLLGEGAHATSKPALEILANDVRCTHGALIKTLDPDQLWYAATRGIGDGSARSMIKNGFLASTFDSIGDTIMREQAYKEIQSLID